MSLRDKLKKSGTIKEASVLSESVFFNEKDVVATKLPILNVAFSGTIKNSGLSNGISLLCGDTQTYKSLLGLLCMAAYLNKYEDAVALFYDNEFGITKEYLKLNGIDPERVIHIPIKHIEALKFDLVSRLESIDRGDKVFIFVDSLGNAASKKEVEDAIEEKSVADMSRAKALRSLFRIITPIISMKDVPCVMINHIYETQELYSKTVIQGGKAASLNPNQIFVITKTQDRDGTDTIGWTFRINIFKSRMVKPKSNFSFSVTYDNGLYRYSGLLDLAIEAGLILQSGAWYQLINLETGEIEGKKIRQKEIPASYYEALLESDVFDKYVTSKYKLDNSALQEEDDVEFVDDEEEE